MPALLLLIVAVIVISVVVGAIAQFLNRLNEAAAQVPPRPVGPRPAPPNAAKDMDRFLAEIDRLRRKAAAEAGAEPPKPAAPPRAEPVARATATPVAPARDAEREQRRRDRERERGRPRQPAARTEPLPPPPPPPSRRIEQPVAPPPPPAPTPGKLEDLPLAPVVTGPAGSTGAPAATRVTKIAPRPRPAAKTDFAKNLTALLGSGQGAAAAIVLTEIFGPPKAKRPG